MTSRARRLSALLVLASAALAATAAAASLPSTLYDGLSWRLVGPFRGGWATVARGVRGDPNVYYFGSAGGGVWKTVDAGRTWHALSSHQPFASVGALAIAPSDPETIYVGSGQVAPRYDIAAGNGVYKSTDGGHSWRHMGLDDTRHIGDILLDAHDPDTVIVAAQGHMFGANAQRGIYRSHDGGRTWQHVLSINDRTGVVDLARDPAHPQHIYAAAWQTRSWPWMSYFTRKAGPGSGIYESTDDGRHWRRLQGAGWPQGDIGRIGLAVTDTAHGTRIYASLDADGSGGGIYRSDDGGRHWLHVNDDGATFGNWYFSRLTADPHNPDVVYASGQSIRRSRDGGRTWTEIKGAPGGDDYHDLWINPAHPQYMITASDQGSVVSVDGGRSWSSWYNQPTGQFYHLATDNRFPYWIYSGQQDSGTVGIASRSDYGSITFRDWHPVGGDERDYDVPDPVDPMIVYGSGLGGRVSRYDARNGQVQNVSPWPIGSYGARPTTVKYRYTWITPLVAQQIAPHAIFVGAQKLFRSTDQGRHWRIVSPDLTGADPRARHCDGTVDEDRASACGFGVIYSIGLSPRDAEEIWVGTDNGLLQLTRDGGSHWHNVTPPVVPAWARIDSIDVGARAGTAYVAVDTHRLGRPRPLLLRTHDYGRHWQRIVHGLPAGHFTTVMRADPVKTGLLYAGTDDGVYVSFNDGDDWQPLQLNLPTAWVRDLTVHGDDLIAATQGRAIWILDDVSPLRQLDAAVARQPAHLFRPATAWRVHPDNNRDTPLPPETPVGTNPPAGAVLDYWLAPGRHGPVTLSIRTATGRLVHRFDSRAEHHELPAERYFAKAWLRPSRPLSTAPGLHRMVWNLRWPRPHAVRYSYSIAAVFGEDTPLTPQGPYVVPGAYRVSLRVDGHHYQVPLTVKPDPRIAASHADLVAELAFQREIAASMEQAYRGDAEQQAVTRQLLVLHKQLAGAARAPLLHRVDALHEALRKAAAAHGFATQSAIVTALETDSEDVDAAPTAAQRAVLAHAKTGIARAQKRWNTLRQGEMARLDQTLRNAGLAPLAVPAPANLHIEPEREGVDLP